MQKKAEFEQVSESRRGKVDAITGTLGSKNAKLSETVQEIASNQELLASKESFLASLAEEYAKKALVLRLYANGYSVSP